MNLTELQKKVDDLKIMLLEPKLFIKDYFGDLINELDIRTTKFINGENKCDESIVNGAEVWREQMVEQLENEETELLNKVSLEFKLDLDFKEQVENLSNDLVNLSLEEYNELEKRLYDYSFRMKRDIIGNQCFVVLCDEIASDIYDVMGKTKNEDKCNQFKFWKKLLPFMQIREGFIDKKGRRLLESLGKSNQENIKLNKETLIAITIKYLIENRVKEIFNDDSKHYPIVRGITGLFELYLDSRNIETIEDGAFSELKQLKVLYLGDNSIKNLNKGTFRGCTNLEMLYLINNNIEMIADGAFDGLDKLEGLFLDNNKMKHVNKNILEGLDNLEELDFSDNEIESIEMNTFGRLRQLKILLMANNKINHLYEETFKGCTNLKYLNLSDNNIKSIKNGTFYGLKQLDKLCLDKNKIKNITKDSFRGLYNLKILNLKDNNIESIDDGAFDGLNLLKELFLENNKIEHFNKNSLRGKIQILD